MDSGFRTISGLKIGLQCFNWYSHRSDLHTVQALENLATVPEISRNRGCRVPIDGVTEVSGKCSKF